MVHQQAKPTVRDLVISVFEANGLLVDTGNKLVHPAGLTTALWQVLGALGYAPTPLPVAHIARNMGLTRQAVQRVVELLVERGMVRYEVNPHHQRAKLVVLTPAGQAALRSTEGIVRPLDDKILARIGPQRLATAIAVLNELSEVLSQFDGSRGDPPLKPPSPARKK